MQRLKKKNDNDNNLVAEEKDSSLEVPNDELETQFSACTMKHKMYKIKKRKTWMMIVMMTMKETAKGCTQGKRKEEDHKKENEKLNNI